MTSADLRVAVVQAGLSVPSSTRLLADQLSSVLTRVLAEQGRSVHVDVIDLRDLAHPLADNLLTGFASGQLAAAIERVVAADALIAVTPVFSASYSGLFKTFFDVLEPESLAGKPVLMAATAGTARHSLVLDFALRPLFAHLKAVPVPTAVFAATDDFGASTGLETRVVRAATELAAMLGTPASDGAVAPVTPVALRRSRSVAEEFADPTPFGEMLAGLGQA